MANGPACKRQRCSGECDGVGGVQSPCLGVEVVIVVSQEIRAPCDQRCDVAIGNGVEQREQVVTDSIAPEPGVIIRRVGGGFKTQLSAHCVRVVTAKTEDRVRSARPDCGESCGAASAKQREQDGLGLVISGVAEHGVFTNHGVPRRPGTSFEVRAVVEVDMFDAQLDTELCRDPRCHLCVAVSGAAQPVMHVHCADVEVGSDGERNQRR